jgi:hypothetical protein
MITITLPPSIEESLREAAQKQRTSPERLAAQIVEDAFAPDPLTTAQSASSVDGLSFFAEALSHDEFPTPEEVVARIKALPKDPRNIRPATASLKELLENAPDDPDFNLAEWEKEWALIEQEMKATTRANSKAEGFDF